MSDATATFEYEPCPACKGKGVRVVPPPPLERGLPRGGQNGIRRHGYESTYASGCRCELCRAARRVGNNRRAAERRAAR